MTWCSRSPSQKPSPRTPIVSFLAVPHTASLAITPQLLSLGVTVIDLSADYRLHDAAVYEQWYGTPHTSPELLGQTVYGLPELNRSGLLALEKRHEEGEAVLVAVPGCYPTATALAAIPALEAGLSTGDLVISDAISGVSGAGRTPNARTHFCHANESVEAYGVAHHRHTPEIEQTLTQVAGHDMNVVFTPHLALSPAVFLATVYMTAADGVTATTCRTPTSVAMPTRRLSPRPRRPHAADLLGCGNRPCPGWRCP